MEIFLGTWHCINNENIALPTFIEEKRLIFIKYINNVIKYEVTLLMFRDYAIIH